MWIGDFTEDHATVTCMFTTHASTGAPVAPNSAFEAADVIIYKNGSATQKATTNGVTMTSPFDSIVGLHCVVIDTSNDTGDGGFWVAGAVYTLVLSPDETVDSVAVAKVIGQFGIELVGALRPTTAGRKLDVSTGGEAGIDWANIGSPTTAVNLSATNIDVDQVVASVSGAVGSVTGAVGSVTGAVGSVTGAVGSVTGNVGGNVTGSVGSVATGGITAASVADGTIDAATFASGALDAVWSNAARTLTAGTNIQLPSNGLANVTAWSVAITGNITGNLSGSVGSVTGLTAANLDVAVSTRLAAGDYTAPLTAAGTRTALGLASANLDTQLTAIDDFLDTEVAAIKAKTDNLPASPAAVGSAMILTVAYDAAKTAATQTSVDDLPTSAELATALGTADDAVLTVANAIKTKTDSLTFTVSGQVDANIQSVNETAITGAGTSGNPWGP